MRRWLLLLAIAPLGCGDISSEVAISFERPRDDGPLDTVDNATLSLSPDGFTEQFAIDGADASFEFELPPDDVSRSLSVFFARGETLVAYGSTPPFTFAGAAGAGVVVFLGYPGTLATLDRDFDLPDASTVLAASPGRGAVALAADGTAVFLDAYTFDLVPIAPYPDTVPDATDGVFVGDDSGSVTRVRFEASIGAARYVYGTDSWSTVSDEDMPPRPGAAAWYEPSTARVFVAGGGELTSILQVEVATEDTTLPTFGELDTNLDGPRVGGALIGRDTQGVGGLLAFGGDDPSLPLAYAVGSGEGSGSAGLAWTDARCTTLDGARSLCAGGSIDGTTTAEGALVDTSAGLEVTRLPDLLPIPMREVVWLEDDAAVYAQGEARLVRVDRATLEVSEPLGSPQRAAGGGAAVLPTGVTLLAGGEAADGSATDVWQLFSPALPGD